MVDGITYDVLTAAPFTFQVTNLAAKLFAREWRRVNDELDQARARPAPVDVEREAMPSLRGWAMP